MGNKPTKIKGKIWVIADPNGKLIDDIDTDMIFHNAHLAITDIAKMGPLAFGNLPGWEDFPKKCGKGDILILGKNFGAGSSRQQAVDCFIALGVQLLIADSFGAIYKRNAINSGLPIVCKEGLAKDSNYLRFKNGDTVEVDFVGSEVKNVSQNFAIKVDRFSKVQMDTFQAGGLHEYGKTLEK